MADKLAFTADKFSARVISLILVYFRVGFSYIRTIRTVKWLVLIKMDPRL